MKRREQDENKGENKKWRDNVRRGKMRRKK